jgi:hypothetical protein
VRQGINWSDGRDWCENVGNEEGFFGKGARIQQIAVLSAGVIPGATTIQKNWILGKESFILLMLKPVI